MKIYQKGFSQEESHSSNLLLSLMKRIEDVTILKFISLEKLLAAHKKVIGVFCFKGTKAKWVQCILKIMFKFMFNELAETNTKICQ